MRRNRRENIHRETATSLRKKLLGPGSPFIIREAYNAVRTKLFFTGKGEKCPIYTVTSSLMHDGKTTNAVNLAISIASTGKRVLLIDGDMRKPAVHRYFGLEAKNGLSEILAGLTKEIRIRKTGINNLSVLCAGQIPPNPAELLGSKQMDTLLEYVREYYEYVLIDTPPINLVTDATILAERVTGYIFVVQSGKNHYREVSYALDTLKQMKATISGFLLNDSDGKLSLNYGYGGYVKSYYHSKYIHYKKSYADSYKEYREYKKHVEDEDEELE